MSVKTAGVGHFQIPTAPAAGVSVTSGAANTYTTTPAQLIASTAAALLITGIHIEAAAVSAASYKSTQLMIGGSGSETIIGQYLVAMTAGSTVALGYRAIFPPIPVAVSTRISAKTADSVGAQATLVTLECIAQSNVVDDGITVGTVNLVNTLTTYTGNSPQTGDSFAVVKSGGTGDNAAIKVQTDKLAFTVANQVDCNVLDWKSSAAPAMTGDAFARLGAPAGASVSADIAAAKVDTAAIKVKTDFLPSVAAGAAGGLFLAGTNAATTITGSLTTTFTGNLTGSVASVTAAVTLPAIPANWITATGIAASALDGKGNWNIGKTGYSISGIKTTLDALNDITAASVWAVVTRVLTAGTNIVLAKGTGITGLNDIAATDIVSAGAITTSAGKVSGVILTDTVTTYTGNTPQTGDAFARVGLAGVGLTNLGDTRVANLDAAVSSRLALSSYTAPDNPGIAAIESLTAAALDATVSSRLASASYTAPPSISAIAAATWDEPLSGHTAAGSTGKALSGAGAAGDPWSTVLPGSYLAGTAGHLLGSYSAAPTAAAIASATWEELLACHVTPGSTGKALSDDGGLCYRQA